MRSSGFLNGRLGKTERILGAAALLMTTSACACVSADTGTESNRYVAKHGDTVYSICRRNHITVEQFSEYNPGTDINGLATGTSVKIRAARSFKHRARLSPEEAGDATESGARNSQNAAKRESQPKLQENSPRKEASKRSSIGYLSYSDPDSGQRNNSEPSVAGSLIRIVLALVFVAGLAYVSLVVLKGFMTKRVPSKSSRQKLHVLETTGLGTNRALHIVQIDGKRLLVGSTADQISLISELEPMAEVEPAAESEQPADFSSVLSRFTSSDRANAAAKLNGILKDGATFLQKKTAAAKSLRDKADSDEK